MHEAAADALLVYTYLGDALPLECKLRASRFYNKGGTKVVCKAADVGSEFFKGNSSIGLELSRKKPMAKIEWKTVMKCSWRATAEEIFLKNNGTVIVNFSVFIHKQ